MIRHIDPTYLRTIHDGLLSGAVHKDNASALPMGLVGMYDEALPHASNVNERKKFLEFFAVWALLKKEVSAAFVVPLLNGWTEDQVIDYIARYSKWFNSPVSGKYQLYHERLRVYLLQKISDKGARALSLQLITLIEKSLNEKSAGEMEVYGLEFFIDHLLVEAMLTGDGHRLLQWAYSPTHWERQLKISKEYTWTKTGPSVGDDLGIEV